MSDAKNQLLARIRAALHRGILSQAAQSALTQSMRHPTRGIIPAYLNTDKKGLIALFIEAARRSASTIAELTSRAEVPNAILQFLKENHLHTTTLQISQDLASSIDFEKYSDLKIAFENNKREFSVSITSALCGISETGTLMMVSAPKHPTLINFLAETHIVVLATQALVPSYEDAWDLIRADGKTPRTVNFITGPSRTADIEQRMLLGVHGPKQLHIILYN
jgi:L-lactate dehydrogenase complex protein LldG